MLYVISTPIGNLEDISPRAITTLKKVHTILAEDTRHTKHLLDHYDIRTPLLSYHQHSQPGKTEQILDMLGEYDLALVSDAGTPGISDPGSKLIALAVENQIEVSPIPGPSACISLAICSGFDLDRFVFLGFLPRKKTAQIKMLDQQLRARRTIIFFESPYRLVKTLQNLQPILWNKQIVVGRELTKKFEEFIRGSAADIIQKYSSKPPKGEISVIISP